MDTGKDKRIISIPEPARVPDTMPEPAPTPAQEPAEPIKTPA